MKFTVSCLLVVAFLSTVSAQTASLGNCDPNIITINNFNSTLLLGRWYQIAKSYNAVERSLICYRLLIVPGNPNVYNFLGTYIDLNNGPRVQNFTVIATNLNRGVFTSSPGIISDVGPLSILETDYANYMIFYSCLDVYQGKIEYVWILSRTPRLDAVLMAEALNVIQNRNINLDIIPEIQYCNN